jgi:glycosyltransferase involved in cell wall biosynthesis
MIFRSRVRRAVETLRWRLSDWFDRIVYVPAIERAANMRLSIGRTGRTREAVKRIYVDVSVIEVNDAGTGIQRVVRSLQEHLPAALGTDVEYETLVVRDSRIGYVSKRGVLLSGAPGSLFFGLDFATDSVFRARHDLRRFKLAGGEIWFLVHDILPLSHPQWFTPASRLKYRRWLRVCMAVADGILCVSPVVAVQVEELVLQRYGRSEPPHIITIDLGSDITPGDFEIETSELPMTAGLDVATFTRAALVVGTLEPRKGHSDVLAAFDLLWNDGHDIPLVLIGRPGWNMDALQDRIRQHPKHGRLLFWLDDVDDEALHAAYRHCRFVIVPSLAEGYGLPLDEALAVGAPVLARDIPVFRRHEGDAPVSYFAERADPTSISASILVINAAANEPRRMARLRQWESTARQVARELRCG